MLLNNCRLVWFIPSEQCILAKENQQAEALFCLIRLLSVWWNSFAAFQKRCKQRWMLNLLYDASSFPPVISAWIAPRLHRYTPIVWQRFWLQIFFLSKRISWHYPKWNETKYKKISEYEWDISKAREIERDDEKAYLPI